MIEKDFVNIDNFLSEGIVKWNSPSNIALVKYWGKKDNQIPQNPSISFTLSKSFTTTSVEFKPKKIKPILLFMNLVVSKITSLVKKLNYSLVTLKNILAF